MKFTYPVVITPGEKGFVAVFPDLEGCRAKGASLEETLENAREAALAWIDTEMEEDHPDFPGMSELEDLKLEEGEIARMIAINYRFYDGWDE